MFAIFSAPSLGGRHIKGMTTDLVDLMHRARKVSVAARTATGNARAVVAQIDGDVIHLQRCAKVFIALGMGDEYAVVESPELAVSYIGNLLPFKRRARP